MIIRVIIFSVDNLYWESLAKVDSFNFSNETLGYPPSEIFMPSEDGPIAEGSIPSEDTLSQNSVPPQDGMNTEGNKGHYLNLAITGTSSKGGWVSIKEINVTGRPMA